MSPEATVHLVAVTGGSGAGKSWLADRLRALFGARAGRLSQDNFYRDCSHLPPAEREVLNFDHPDAIDWEHFGAVLQDLRANRACRLPDYDFATHCRLPGGVLLRPASVMFVDGLWLLHHAEIRRQFDLTLYLHCPESERLRRRVARDTVERGRKTTDVERQFEETVMPMHRQFVSPQAAHADLLMHHPSRDFELLQLQERLSRLVRFGPDTLERFFSALRAETQLPAQAAGVSR